MSDYWIDPPKNNYAGGRIISKASDGSISEVINENQYYYAQFNCDREWFIPLLSHHYESYYDKSYFKFKLPTPSGGSFSSATLHVMVALVENIQVVETADIDLLAYYRSSFDADDFPTVSVMLDSDDQPDTDWTQVGSFGTVAQVFTGYYTEGGPYWMNGLDVSNVVNGAIASGWEYIGFKVQLSEIAPSGWDYDHRETSADQLLSVVMQGATTAYYSNNLPSSHPSSYDYVCPWLQITYSGLPSDEEQEEVGEEYTTSGGSNPYGGTINCIAADPKSKSAVAGTTAGGLWYCWSGGGYWSKIYEVDDEITAVYMDQIRNLLDYPQQEVAWFGTDAGEIYKSVNALAHWNYVTVFDSAVVEIQGSELDSNKVVVGTESDGIYVTRDGGETWQQVLAPS